MEGSNLAMVKDSLKLFQLVVLLQCNQSRDQITGDFWGAFVWDQSGIRIFGIMRVSVCLGAILIPEYLDFHSSYSAPRSRIAGICSGIFQIYSGIYSYSGISQTNASLV